ncbi:MAG: hypothetical protein JXR83_01565 [Deltaproteobacteria bacterium]|nr:hypothetical protein [Deltaproteobacteria bacterium]
MTRCIRCQSGGARRPCPVLGGELCPSCCARDQRRRELTDGECAALEALQATAWPSLFEIQQVQVDTGLQLTDLATGDALFVRERSGTHQASKFDLLLAWVVQLGDHL